MIHGDFSSVPKAPELHDASVIPGLQRIFSVQSHISLRNFSAFSIALGIVFCYNTGKHRAVQSLPAAMKPAEGFVMPACRSGAARTT